MAAGGHAPPAAAALVLTLLVTALAVRLSGRRWTASPLLGLFLLAQGGVHVAAMSAAPMSHGSGLDPLMITTHAVAAVALVLTVLQGEAALVAVLDRLVPAPGRRLVLSPVAHRAPVRVGDDAAAGRWVPALLRGRAPPLAS